MPAPKGNKYALGNKGGRPRTFTSVKELKKKIDEYFESCWEEKEEAVKVGKGKNAEIKIIKNKVQTQHYTISGLALFLGTDSFTLRNYEKREGYEEFFNTIKEAKTKIENYVEQMLYRKESSTGAIFNLKVNFGHIEKSVVENVHSGEIGHTHKSDVDNYEKIEKINKKYNDQLFEILKGEAEKG